MTTTDPRPTCGHEDCTTWRDPHTGEHVTYCGFAIEMPLEVAA
ncbi:hypothetical protein [Nocardia rhizosphaerae]|uniref:Uncharacterized protein n=1 Tax=Nocardia rhizosphaerae TaxID=1691571 RepID=A0ABV8LDB4_9NOCA